MLTAEPRPVDRRVLLGLVVAVLVVALVVGGLAVVDRVRGGASSPTALAERVVTALDEEDLGALVRLVEPGERTALVRLGTAWSRRLADLDLPAAVGGGAPGSPAALLDGLDLKVTGATPRVQNRTGDVAVVGLGDVSVRLHSDPGAAHGLLRAWFAYRHDNETEDVPLGLADLPGTAGSSSLVAVQRSGRWYLSVLGTLLGPDLEQDSRLRVEVPGSAGAPTPRAAVEATLRTLTESDVQHDVGPLTRTLDASGADAVQLWASAVDTGGLDASSHRLASLTTSDGPADRSRAVVRVDSLQVGTGSGFAIDGRCLTVAGDRTCLRPSGYRYEGGLGSLSWFDLLGHDGAFALTAVHGSGGWRTSLPESLADALAGYADGLTREQVLMVLGQERLDAPTGVLLPDHPEQVPFSSGGYAIRTFRVTEPGLYRVAPSPAGANRASVYGPDGEPAIEPFFPNDSVYRLTPGDHTVLVWADDDFSRALAAGRPYAQRLEIHRVD